MNFNIFTKSIYALRQNLITQSLWRSYAKPAPAAIGGKKKKLGKLGPVIEKKEIPVETDANKLVSYVCGSNILKTGEDIKLKADSEYPDWLWSINVDRIIPIEEMDPETKQYWRRLRKQGLRRNNQLSKLKKF